MKKAWVAMAPGYLNYASKPHVQPNIGAIFVQSEHFKQSLAEDVPCL